MHVYRNVENPNQVLATMWWWDSAESCRHWAKDHEAEAMEKLGGVTSRWSRSSSGRSLVALDRQL